MERLHGELLFLEAFECWIEKRIMRHATLVTNARYISERTEWDYRQYARALNKFFVGMKLRAIHPGNLDAYQRGRAFNEEQRWNKQAGANRIRKEISMLVRILTEAGCWGKEFEDRFDRIQAVESDVPRALSPVEQTKLLTTAGRSERWSMIYSYIIVALQTTASTNELRGLRIGDVRLDQGIIQIRVASAKNRFRVRTIPVETQECRWALESLMQRAMDLAGCQTHHYLFPFRLKRGEFDPSRPMSDSGLRKLWDEVRIAAELPWVRPYDLRHTAITRLAEDGVSISTILAMAGHIDTRMQQHYTTISMTAKRKSIASTWSAGVPKPNWGIQQGTGLFTVEKKIS